MKIALCQINTTIGAFQSNADKILQFYQQALERGAGLVAFPELVVTGYPPLDLLYQDQFVHRSQVQLERLAARSTVPLLLGYVRREGEELYNSAALCQEGAVRYVYDKILLPTYDVFDEDRYFSAGKKPGIQRLAINGREVVLGIEICEDLWDEDYDYPVSRRLKEEGAEVIVNISASPYHEGQLVDRHELIARKVQETGLPLLYCNLVGAQDELIFDGDSLALDGGGKTIAQGKAFQEDILIVDLEESPPLDLQVMPREEELYSALCLGVRDYFHKTGHSTAVIGLSGGIDSSLVACIAADALGPDQVHGVSMPSRFSSAHSRSDAQALAENLGIDYQSIPIEDVVGAYEALLAPQFGDRERDATEENIQARVRGNLLMAFSNKFDWLVLSTGNKTELALGYCTLYGDMSGGLAVISDLLKTDVYALARWVNRTAGFQRIPENCLSKPPSAELTEDQVDPFDYDLVSPLVSALVEEQASPEELIAAGNDPELVGDLYRRIRTNEYKRRQAAPGLRVSPKAFGLGRRIPIVNQYDGNQQ